MQKRVSIGAVARAAGVDPATASRALSGHPHVAAATRARVRALAEELGYRPDPALAAMARDRWLGRSGRNANVLAYVASAGAEAARREECFAGARVEAERLGWRLDLFALPNYPDAEALARVLTARGVQGILLRIDRAGVGRPHLPWARFAAAHVSLPPDTEAWLDAATPDVFASHLRAMRELLRRGYRRPGLVLLGPRYLADELRRAGGVLAAWSEAGAKGRPPPILWLEDGPRARQAEVLREWVEAGRLDAVLGQTDTVALGLEAAGWRFPGPVGFVSLSAGAPGKSYARARPDLGRVGATAAGLVAARLHQRSHGLPEAPLQVAVPGIWEDGASLRAPARE